MTVAELIAHLSGAQPEAQVQLNVGGTQVEDFNVSIESDGVVLRDQDITEISDVESPPAE